MDFKTLDFIVWMPGCRTSWFMGATSAHVAETSTEILSWVKLSSMLVPQIPLAFGDTIGTQSVGQH